MLQLALYQGDCCDTPPQDFCTLCENASQNYNTSKVIPQDPRGPPYEVTCDMYATGDKYLLEGAPGVCNDTERGRARAWCEVRPKNSLGVQQNLPLRDSICKDGPKFSSLLLLFYENIVRWSETLLCPDLR